MKSAGVLASPACEHHAFGASLAAMLLVLIASTLASAQSAADTTASETWRLAAASAAASPTAAGPSNLVPTTLDNLEKTPPATIEIAPASPDNVSQHPNGAALDAQTAAESQPSNESNDIAKYQAEQSGLPPQQMMQQQFDNDGELSTPFGMQLREAKRTLKSGEDADGLLITAVQQGGPAATAGLHPYTHGVHDALTGVAIAAAMTPFGMPAILLIPALDIMQVGESYDMIIGVDGSRVTNFLDFQDRMRDLQPGEIIYLSIVRNGKRIQVTLPVTADILQANTN
jgi:S1-C subfamily serine protease